ncbi:glycosylated lysosomal membrane protein-like isoform X2 [Venturia canescens]|uniref:glycosylated lysosomal membrane protein-like isoform X2 n=1 Tax=Venturia canescens TaxID=32260 RepID=UPI001C9C7261|nr:glycosylated lysosomal membrane protein-like isoform X2 [Venturia canescens]
MPNIFSVVIKSAIFRMLKTFLNPGCNDLCIVENVTTVYLRAEGSTDTLHYIWDFFGNPSLLLAVTSPSTQLNVNWNEYLLNQPNSIQFTEEPQYTFGVVLQKFYEFNDVNDTGVLGTMNDANINVLDTKMFNWIRNGVSNNTNFVELLMNGNDYNDFFAHTKRQGDVQIMLNGFCTLDHSDVMPHMLHSENSTQIDIVLNNLQTNSSFTSSRFAMELLLVSESETRTGMFVDAKKSLDDEHTPGIFEVIELRTPLVKLPNGEQSSAYLQWRPVSYTGPSRDVSESTEIVNYLLVNITKKANVAKNSLLHAYYGKRIEQLLVEKMNVSLGMKGDGFYKKNNYSTWTFLVGYGTPPAEQFSYLVIMIMAIGLGLPVLLMLAVGIYFCVRRIPKRYDNAFINS